MKILKLNKIVHIHPQIFIDLLLFVRHSDEFRGCTSEQNRQGLIFKLFLCMTM
jgi:hypothetical protein